MIVHFLGTIFGYTVYTNFSSLGDGYLPENFIQAIPKYGDFNRSLFAHGVY